MSAASYHPRLVALLGFIGAAFLLIIGYSIGSIGGTEPLGPRDDPSLRNALRLDSNRIGFYRGSEDSVSEKGIHSIL